MDVFRLNSKCSFRTMMCGNKSVVSFLTSRKLIFLVILALFLPAPCCAQTQPPIISVPSGTLGKPTQVAIAGVTGSTVYFTVDGLTTPSTSSPVYVGPIRVNYSQTVKAISVLSAVSSTVSSATYTLNSVRWPAPDPADTSTLKINLHLPTTGIPK
jgi:hypothetical protein